MRKKTAAKSAKRRRRKPQPAATPMAGWLGRVGYAARGAIYLTVGGSAALTTFDPNHRPGGFTEALAPLQHHWLGAIALVLLAAGLACLAGWLTVEAIYRRDHPGHAHAVLVAGTLGDAAVYIAFMGSVVGMVFGARSGGDEDLQSWIGWLIASGFGRALVMGAAVIVCACGLGLLGWGAAGDIEGPLELPPLEKKLVLPIGRYGTAGRGAAIALIGGYLLLSALHGDPRQAHALGGALKEMRSLSWGAAVTGAFALAFIASAALDFVVAAFRHFNPSRPRTAARAG